ncbi:hypothetical protein PN465_00820 [Nodularia spumigena CS-584]|jgi:hypothetical protein|uniref:NAD/NADP transhydrogenase beta subunit n=3 Tax=Nodularia spumigena TaxID=70799 RepID=A0A2S0PYV1_NODSP|nr:hypothetical protein [Nodularia spumigena]AHJ26910.1 NAD/NADP transhydrogenase beta subunit [Nodularia spumigena CCY9414]AVZ29586.1 hypothetical protein BMF81_00298 [Nodularia spumigena UHCC 0039]EAW44471.1 hypothetical protein N9414_03758 [Nodularia spumigena CCY9414]KZL49325.1 hypothetical protein A2T98_13360 [Nodularia spumigena CENA596]MDB9343155.1 hypothetical protein [Nodularia spumigena CS-588/06]
MQLYILQIFPEIGINETFDSGAATARSMTESWDNQWLDLLQNNTSNNLYGALTNLGVFFAVGTLLFFMMQWLKDVIYSEYSRPITGLIWPFIVVLLLSNGGDGSILSNLTLGVRNFINTVNQQVVTTADAEKNYQQALNMSLAEEIAGSLLRPCQSLTGEQQTQCFAKASDQIDKLWREYRDLYGNRIWIERLENKVISLKFGTGNLSDTTFNSLLGNTAQTSIKNFLISLQYAFQNLIEATMLLIAALGPLAVGASLLPVAGKPIYAWLTGLFSAGIAKISFNIIAAVTAAVIINGPAENPNANPDLMWFIIFLGILAPLLSLAVAGAGGFAVFSAINNTNALVKDRI